MYMPGPKFKEKPLPGAEAPKPRMPKAPLETKEPLMSQSVRAIQRLVQAEQKVYRGTEENRRAAIEEVNEILKSRRLFGPEDLLDPDAVFGNGRKLRRHILSMMELANRTNSVRSVLESPDALASVSFQKTTPHYVLLISDPEGRLSQNPIAKMVVDSLLEGLGQVRRGNAEPLKMHIQIKGELLGVHINDGKHRGFINALCTGEAPAFIFKHYEHGGGKYAKNRVKYLENILRHCCGCETDFFRPETTSSTSKGNLVGYCRGVSDWLLRDTMRAAASAKDMDLSLLEGPTETEVAQDLFKRGVTNLQHFWSYARSARGIDGSKAKHLGRWFNPAEQALLKRYSETRDALESGNQAIRRALRKSRQAKKLNFEILEDLTEMQFNLLRTGEGEFVPKREVVPLFERAAAKLLEMAKISDAVFPQNPFEKKHPYTDRAQELISEYRFVLSGISSWVIIEEEVPQIMQMCADKGGNLELEDVETLEEMVRFLHSRILEPQRYLWALNSVRAGEAEDLRVLGWGVVDSSLPDFVCIDAEGKMPGVRGNRIYRILAEQVKRAGEGSARMNDGKRAVAIIGKDFADISLPMGKHYAEINLNLDNKNRTYVLGMRYVDTLGGARMEYLSGVLESLGFKTSRENGRVLKAKFTTGERKKLEYAYSELLRLNFSSANLDLQRGFPSDYAIELFEDGFTHIRHASSTLEDIARRPWGERLDTYMHLLNLGILGAGDKAAFADTFLNELGYRSPLIGSVMGARSLQENDNLLWALITLEAREKEAGRIAKVRRIRRVAKELEKVMERKERAEEVP